MRYKLTDKELDQVLKNLIILVDTRENANSHIISSFDKLKIKYESCKNDFGDYSAKLPVGSFAGQARDIYFDRFIVIERKNSIDELAGNLKDDVRLNTELAHLNKYGIKYYIFVEDENFDNNIRNSNYRSQYNNKALYARLKTLEARYNTIIRPVSKVNIGSEIYNTLKYYIREQFKNKGIIEEEGEEVARIDEAI